MERGRIGDTGVRVTALGFGGAALGNLYAPVEAGDAIAAVRAAYDSGVRYFDTAPSYGSGLSELRLGAALAPYPRDELTISTKVGYALDPVIDPAAPNMFKDTLPYYPRSDFSAAAVEASLAESMERLGTDRFDVVWLHDPDAATSLQPEAERASASHFDQAMGEAYPLLDRLRADGTIGAIGVGINQWEMLEDFARAGEFDCFLLAGRYTLLEQGALASFLPLCLELGTSVVVGGPYSSGILATGASAGARYNYARAPEPVLERVREIEAVCARHGVDLRAAALQFPLAHPAVVSVIPGARSPAEAVANSGYMRRSIPSDFWREMRDTGLIDRYAPVPDN